jgi:hypothetical protein
MNTQINSYLTQAHQAIENLDYAEAVVFFLMAEDMGSIEAKIGLAALCIGGYYQPDDLVIGLYAEKKLLQVIENKLAPRNLVALALNNLASLYATGADGLVVDMQKSIEAANRAEILGFPS